MQTLPTELVGRLSRRDQKWLQKKLGTTFEKWLTLFAAKPASDALCLPEAFHGLLYAATPIVLAVLDHLNPPWKDDFIERLDQKKQAQLLHLSDNPPSVALLTLLAEQWLNNNQISFEIAREVND